MISPFETLCPMIDPAAHIHPSAQVIGEVRVAAGASIWCNSVVRGDVQRIEIGAQTNIQDLCMLHVSHRSAHKPEGSPLLIGARVTVGHSVILHGCRIGDECLIGMGCIVMDDAVIEPRTLLGAGSLVPAGKHLPGGFLYMGRPAVAVRALTEAELGQFDYSASHYVRLAERHGF